MNTADVIANNSLKVVGNSKVGEGLGKVLGIGVGDFAQQKFGANTDDFGAPHNHTMLTAFLP